MGLKDFRIAFDNQWSTYYPGQTVTGNIIVVLDSTKKIRGISVKVKGEANTCWATEKQEMDERGQYRDETQTVTAHEEYFETKYYLVGSASGGEIEIQSGEHKFPFTCTLPTNLPSSFESDFGHVRYTVKATLDRPWKFDQDVKSPFTVITPLDLNQEPRAAESVQQEMSKTFCCLCCGTPPLTVNFSLPVRGYVPGQSMPIKINVENLSNVVVNIVKLVLCKIVTFRATTPHTDTKKEEIVVTEVSKGPVEAGGTTDYEQHLDIPPLPPSNLANCGIIDLEYNLKVEACVEGWYHRNLSANTLIFVGTVPLAVYHVPSAPPAGMDGDYSAKPPEAGFVIPSTNTALPPLPESHLYPNLPPPSFEESLHGARNLRDRGESEYVYGLTNHFAPKYPVYNFASAQ
ncbi:Arrestin domain-containing protein 3 [Trachymyrmex zeteki]|uniref:Arrestin domain-containing protein 3 n=1 Tax=Mycetomoellerius zeteki TaxID=64791 RepID=A0A151X444_9HYME|nr:PREDICTED: arrestin domain-containing protein 17 [Trachymyrmex zeteki]XP_018304183.1 PREDICTED: arrestin domain-containing protein 17 [Trachymyrmex zeteki]KYQ55050.1 Arrestin domain-containing protein 3 [Trachymyrmex zeteki]